MTTLMPAAHGASTHHHGILGNEKVRDAVEFVLIWAGVVVLAVAAEIGSLYLLSLFR